MICADTYAWDRYAEQWAEHVTHGQRCTFRPFSTIGSTPFAFDGPRPRPARGGVEIGDDVDIFEHANVDRGTVGPTVIGSGCKIDRHVQIGHDARLGSGVVVCAGAVIGGHVRLGAGVRVGMNATIRNRVTVGAGAVIGIGAVVTKDVPPGVTVAGNPARVLPGVARV